MRRFTFLFQRTPYVVFFALVLVPVGLLCYALAAVARTAKESWRAGWKSHD